MFKTFGEYMFYLLNAPLKKNKETNQFHIFFQVMGEEFDDLKGAILRLRLETLITTASTSMLDIHGQERDMYRIKGEDDAGFRKRLKMKGVIAELAGSEKGIRLALEAVGYENCSIEPLWKSVPERWAEFYVDFHMQNLDEGNPIDFECIKREVMKVKQASTKPNYRFRYPTAIKGTEKIELVRIINGFEIIFWDFLLILNGGFRMDGSNLLNAEMVSYFTKVMNRLFMVTNEDMDKAMITTKNNLWYIDGSDDLSGTKKMDAYIEEEMV